MLCELDCLMIEDSCDASWPEEEELREEEEKEDREEDDDSEALDLRASANAAETWVEENDPSLRDRAAAMAVDF
jgi:hypothetical protein